MLRVILADDHYVVRQGLRSLLEKDGRYHIVAEAECGTTALNLVNEHKPDILVIDILMPNLNGIEVTRQVTHDHPETRVLIMSIYSNEAFVLEALRAGVCGYLLKGASPAEILSGMESVAAGRLFLGYPLSDKAIRTYVTRSNGSRDAYDALSLREKEVMQLIIEGHNSSEVASLLKLSVRTVEGHRSRILKKLCLSNHFELLRYAIRRGIVNLDEMC